MAWTGAMFVLPVNYPTGRVGTQVTFLGLKFAESSVQELLLLWEFSSACPLAFFLHHVEPQISQARSIYLSYEVKVQHG